MKPGDVTTINVNQGDREATVLATIGIQALVEYTMPAGTTALQLIDIRTPEPMPGRSVSYTRLPRKWLQAIVDAGMDWDGNPQAGQRPPKPEAMLASLGGRKRIGVK